MTQDLPALRRAGPADAAAIRTLTRSVYAKWIPAIGREPRPMAADYDLAVRRHWIDLAEDDSGITALIEMIPLDDALLIENIAVRQDRQGRGLASALLCHSEAVARRHGLTALRLYTNAAFATNLAFYQSRGFTEAAHERLPDGGTMVNFTKAVS